MDGLAADSGIERPEAEGGAPFERAALRLDDRHLDLWRDEVCDRLLDAELVLRAA